jgi:hypothetical protein
MDPLFFTHHSSMNNVIMCKKKIISFFGWFPIQLGTLNFHSIFGRKLGDNLRRTRNLELILSIW